MRTLENIWSNLTFGDIVLYQDVDGYLFSVPKLVCIVGINVWDMAVAVYYVDYKCFNQWLEPQLDEPLSPKFKRIEINAFGEWSDYWHILGHWKTMPKFKNLLKAYRKMYALPVFRNIYKKWNIK